MAEASFAAFAGMAGFKFSAWMADESAELSPKAATARFRATPASRLMDGCFVHVPR
jgi:hypothetical protein